MATLHETLQTAINAWRDIGETRQNVQTSARQHDAALALLQQRIATFDVLAARISGALDPGEYAFGGYVIEVRTTGVVIRQIRIPPDREINAQRAP